MHVVVIQPETNGKHTFEQLSGGFTKQNKISCPVFGLLRFYFVSYFQALEYTKTRPRTGISVGGHTDREERQ